MRSTRPIIGILRRPLHSRHGGVREADGIPLPKLSESEHGMPSQARHTPRRIRQCLGLSSPSQAKGSGRLVPAHCSIGHPDNAVRMTTPNCDYRYLSPELRLKRMIRVLIRRQACSSAAFGQMLRSPAGLHPPHQERGGNE